MGLLRLHMYIDQSRGDVAITDGIDYAVNFENLTADDVTQLEKLLIPYCGGGRSYYSMSYSVSRGELLSNTTIKGVPPHLENNLNLFLPLISETLDNRIFIALSECQSKLTSEDFNFYIRFIHSGLIRKGFIDDSYTCLKGTVLSDLHSFIRSLAYAVQNYDVTSTYNTLNSRVPHHFTVESCFQIRTIISYILGESMSTGHSKKGISVKEMSNIPLYRVWCYFTELNGYNSFHTSMLLDDDFFKRAMESK